MKFVKNKPVPLAKAFLARYNPKLVVKEAISD
jgi:hypothetical protein